MADPKHWISTGVKPLSANKMHIGRKVDSGEYRKYKAELLRRLPDIEIPDGPLRIRVLACFSSKLADLDNVLKPFLDILQKRYGFNDRDVHRIVAEKKIVPKGEETLVFSLDHWVPSPSDKESPDVTQEKGPHCGGPLGSATRSS